MGNTESYFILAIVSGVGLAFFYQGFKTYRRYAMVRDLPRSTMHSLAMGLVEVHGTVHAEETLVTPFSSTTCVYFRYEIEELRKSGKNSTRWVTIAKGERHVRFWAKDETGKALIDPSGAEFTLDVQNEYRHRGGLFGGIKNLVERLGSWGDSKEDIKQSLFDSMPKEELQLVDTDKLFNWYSTGDRRLREYCLEPNDKLFMIGTAAHDPDNSGAVVICKGENNPMFFIGDRGEKAILSGLRTKWLISFAIGFVAILGGLTYLLHQLGML